jgi:hypothetical protein
MSLKIVYIYTPHHSPVRRTRRIKQSSLQNTERKTKSFCGLQGSGTILGNILVTHRGTKGDRLAKPFSAKKISYMWITSMELRIGS